MKSTNTEGTFQVENYRKMVVNFMNLHLYESAQFWADKVVSITNSPKDVHTLGQTMYLLKQYHRAVHLIRSRNLENKYIQCNYLAVKCLYEANEFGEALKVMNLINADCLVNNTLNNVTQPSFYENDILFFGDDLESPPRNVIFASFLHLKGKVLESMDNRGPASECYRTALHYDVHCYEAFDTLIKYQMLTAAEEYELVSSLPVSQQCSETEAEILLTLYRGRCKKYHTPITLPIADSKSLSTTERSDLTSPMFIIPTLISTPNALMATQTPPPPSHTQLNLNQQQQQQQFTASGNVADQPAITITASGTPVTVLQKIRNSLDMHVSEAERLLYNCDYKQCFKLTEEILKADPYHSGCLPVHVSCLVELNESNKLFTLAHMLVDLYPNLAISWFAVGCYYYLIKRNDYGRRFFAKATCLDRLFGVAWLAYGHSFAIENEHDQAMAAYFKASQLMRGCHLPFLYIGLECGLTNNVRLAEKFFKQAQTIAPDDPFVMHEMGTIAFQNSNFEEAERHFKGALALVKKIEVGMIGWKRWISLLNNLGHTCRKLKKYNESLEYHQQALVLNPNSDATYAAIAFNHALMRRNDTATDWFHKALGLRSNDLFSTTMLNYVIENYSEEAPPYRGASDGEMDKHFLQNWKRPPSVSLSKLEETGMMSESGEDAASSRGELPSMSIEMDSRESSGEI